MELKCYLFCFAIVLISGSCQKKQSGQGQNTPPPSYPTITVSQQNAVTETVYPAIIRGEEDIEIKPRIDGFIDAIHVDEGAIVKKGDKLFDINSPQTQQSVIASQEALNSAKAQANTAKLNVERLRPLAEKKIISDVQLKTQENAYQAALAAQAQAQSNLVNANATNSWINVTSPVDGVVGEIPYRRGSLVNSSNTLTTVASTGNVYAYFSMNEKELMDLLKDLKGNTQEEKIKNIPEASLILATGDTFPEKGKVETIAGSINTSTGSGSLRVKFPNSQGILRSGISGRVVIPHPLSNVIVIPQKSTFNIQDKTLVYKVEADSVVQKVINVLPLPGGQNYAVTNGLTAGERIVSDGIVTLSNGKKITPATP